MNKYLIAFFAAFISYLILDGTMMYFFTGKLFGSMIQKIQNGKPMKTRIIPALLCFIVLAFGIVYFIVDKVRDNHIIEDSLRYGFILGFVIYAVFDLTNYAIFENYTLAVTIIDILWGSVLAFLVTVITKYVMKIRS